MKLSAKAVETAKPAVNGKPTKLSDGMGLQLWIMPGGSKLWRLAYRFAGKQKLLALGAYPTFSLAEARDLRDKHRKLLALGRDPSIERKINNVNTFSAAADGYLAQMRLKGRADATINKNEWLLSFARPSLGTRPVSEITSADVLAVLRGLEARGRRESARRARAIIGGVFRQAIAEGKATTDPTIPLQGQIEAPQVKHRAAIVDARPFGGLLRAFWDSDEIERTTRAALKLCALLAPRPGELRLAEWSEFDLDSAVWVVPAGRMKMRRPHASPLPRQAIAILRELYDLTGTTGLLFPGSRDSKRSISDGTLIAALRRLGFGKDDASAHGFRASFSSFANESGKWNSDAIERQLAHGDEDKIRGAYARSPYWLERTKLMQWWADECDQMRRGAEVIPLRRGA